MTPFIITLIIVSLVEAVIIIRLSRALNEREQRVRKILGAIARNLKGGRL